MKLKSNVIFRLERRKDKETNEIITKNVPIFLDFTFDNKRLLYFTGFRIDVSKWDEAIQRVKKNNFNKAGFSSSEINDKLDLYKSTVTTIYKEAKVMQINPGINYMRDELKKRLKEEPRKEQSFFDVFNEFLQTESQKNNWTKGTLAKFMTTYNHLQQYQKEKHRRIDFDSIDDNFLINYMKFLRDNLNQRNTTVAKNIKLVKWFLNWALKKDYNKNSKFRDFTPNLKGTVRNNNIFFLTWDELMHLYDLKIEKPYLDQVRDVFCFCCFTGLRYSDVFNLKRGNIKENTIEFTTMKTDDALIIDLNDFSKAILKKYKTIPFKNDKCLPVISSQKMNAYIKELCLLAGFNSPETIVYYKGAERIEETYKKWELMSTHVGRKTFITNALFLNIPAEVIQTWTGQKDHKIMERYYKIIDPQKRREMDKFNMN